MLSIIVASQSFTHHPLIWILSVMNLTMNHLKSLQSTQHYRSACLHFAFVHMIQTSEFTENKLSDGSFNFMEIFLFFYYRIAIAGNNKRINILDLSTLKRDNVEIQSLTSKIQGKVLALAWHPTNENLLSFSTNEGRVSFHMKIGAQTIITFQIKFRIEGWCLQHQ